MFGLKWPWVRRSRLEAEIADCRVRITEAQDECDLRVHTLSGRLESVLHAAAVKEIAHGAEIKKLTEALEILTGMKAGIDAIKDADRAAFVYQGQVMSWLRDESYIAPIVVETANFVRQRFSQDWFAAVRKPQASVTQSYETRTYDLKRVSLSMDIAVECPPELVARRFAEMVESFILTEYRKQSILLQEVRDGQR